MSRCTPKNRVRNQFSSGQGLGQSLAGFPQLADVDSILQHFLGQGPVAQPKSPWNAPASLWETETHYHVEVEAAGVSSEQVEITAEKNEITISLERKIDDSDRTYLYSERANGKVSRAVRLPDTADLESLEAKLELGVLRLSVAKRPEAKPRKIEVQTS